MATTVMGRCPSHIKALLDLGNLTGKLDPVSLADLWLNLDATQDMWTAAKQAVVALPRPFQEYVGPVGFETRETFVPRWENVYRARRTLTAIINTLTGPVDLHEGVGPQVATLRRDANGRLLVALAADMQALAGLPASRLARCRQCGGFVWMSRRRQEPFCSAACRQADWRERNPEQYQQLQAENERKRAAKEARGNTRHR